MKAKIVVILASLVVLGIVVHLALENGGRGENENPPHSLGNGESQSARKPILFNRTVQVNSPPLSFKAKGLGNRVDRLLDRLIWGTHRSVRITIDSLVETVDMPIVDEVIRRINANRRDRATVAKKYIDLLAELRHPGGLSTLLDCAGDPVRMIRIAALKGLSGNLGRGSTEAIIEQAELGDEQIKTLCLDILTTRRSPEIYSFYCTLIEEEESVRIMKFAVEGLGNYDTAESRERLHGLLDDPRLDITTSALQSLVRLGDPIAVEQLEAMLRHEGPVRRINAALILAHANWVPPLSLVNELAADKMPHVRVHLTNSLIQHLESDSEEDREKAKAGLRILLQNDEAEVRWKAMESLYRSGDQSVALPLLRKLTSSNGAELAEAVESTTSILSCGEAGPLLIRRFREDGNLTAQERVTILNGLASLKDPAALDLFFEVIGGGWQAKIQLLGEVSVAHHAAFRVHHLGDQVLARWRQFIENDNSDTAVYLFINSVRSLEDPDAAVDMARIARERRYPEWIRREAVRTFAFLLDPQAGKILLDLHKTCRDREITGLALNVYWNYF